MAPAAAQALPPMLAGAPFWAAAAVAALLGAAVAACLLWRRRRQQQQQQQQKQQQKLQPRRAGGVAVRSAQARRLQRKLQGKFFEGPVSRSSEFTVQNPLRGNRKQ